MLKIEVKEGEKIERALKRYKRKFRRVNVLAEIKERRYYTKLSEERRETIKKAIHRRQYLEEHAEL